MLHVIVKLYSGKSKCQKQALALAVADAKTHASTGSSMVATGRPQIMRPSL